MKKLLFMLLVLPLGITKAERNDGLDLCRVPEVRAYVVDEVAENWISSGPANGQGGIFCGVVIGTSPASANDYVMCINSAPTVGGNASGTVAATVTITNTDNRLLFPILASSGTVGTSNFVAFTSFFQPMRFSNLECQISNQRTPAVVYINTSVK